MSDDAASILNAAMKLSESDRLALALALHDSVPSDQEELSEAEFIAELDRRRAESERDPSSMIPWEEVKRMMGS